MAKYLLEVNYTLDGVRGVIAEGGTARRAAAQAAAESVGGTVESFYFAFGGADVYVVADLPDNAAAAALALAVSAGGGATTNTVVLLTTDEVDAAAAKQVGYRPPGG
ncbi:MAG TPA: GYD domain-containing protein [Candidatus Limnocylindria bacterium]|nr:GYD domain-containing protein [Candidatus Limnocylindria bacterium]